MRARTYVIASLSVLVAGVSIGGASAHDGGPPITEKQALERLAGRKIAGGNPDSCKGVDRAVKSRGLTRYRHFYCYFIKATSFGQEGPTELAPVARVELHSLASGTTVLLNLRRRWTYTPPWIDDRPPGLGSLVGLPLASAISRLEKTGYDIIGGARGSYTIATERGFKDVTTGVVVCAQQTRGTGTKTEVTLTIGFKRCSGPPFLAPPTPNLRGLTIPQATSTLKRAGIDLDNWHLADRLTPNYEGRLDGWITCNQTPAAGKRAWSVVIGIAKTAARCP